MKRYVVLGVLVVCSGLAVAGIEFDNSVNGTSQKWEFYNISFPGEDIFSDEGINTEGPAIAVLDYGSGTGGHMVTIGDHDGIMFDRENLGITMIIPNYDIDNPYKEIYVEIVYWGEISDASVTWQGMTQTAPGVVEDEVLEDGWRMYSAIWTIQPNPTVETVQYSFVPGLNQYEAILDYVLVETSCIPEPATLLLFGLGGLVLRKRRRG